MLDELYQSSILDAIDTLDAEWYLSSFTPRLHHDPISGETKMYLDIQLASKDYSFSAFGGLRSTYNTIDVTIKAADFLNGDYSAFQTAVLQRET